MMKRRILVPVLIMFEATIGSPHFEPCISWKFFAISMRSGEEEY
jgi:hypothetical protein